MLLLVSPGCDDSTEGSEADAGPVVYLLVDTNRDGVLSTDDDPGKGAWSAERGAVFLANIDDDDEDGDDDASDDDVDGEADELDLARVEITPWLEAPEGAHGTLEIDEAAGDRIRMFRQDGTAWSEVEAPIALDAAALLAGTAFAIEGLGMMEDDEWDGRVTLTLTVHEAAAKAGEKPVAPILVQSAVLRQAPMVIPWNTAPTLRVFVSDINSFAGAPLIGAIDNATADVDIESFIIDALDPDYVFPDQWTQDFFEIGASYLPSEGGLHRMGVGIRLKPPQGSGFFVDKEIYGPDYAAIYPFPNSYDPFLDGSSLDYGGNLEVVPPHDGYPVGRLLVGSTPARHADPTFFAMLEAQYAQGPVLEPDTEWLIVGHIDEVVSFVADPSSPRGWRALLQAPREAWDLLQAAVNADPAAADLVLFDNKAWIDFSTGFPYSAERTIGQVLADADLAVAQDVAQARADELREFLKDEVGLTDEDFVELPLLWWTFAASPSGGLRHVAYSPSVVNLLTFNGVAIVSSVFGPVQSGQDILEQVTRQRLEALGLDVRFVDVWDLYHRLDGGVHCGSNVDRTLPPEAAWWEMSR